jgi:hypothetical protein
MVCLINWMNEDFNRFFARKVSQHIINSTYDQRWAIARGVTP